MQNRLIQKIPADTNYLPIWINTGLDEYLHGNNINGYQYLSRLFDFDLKLPVNRESFYTELMIKNFKDQYDQKNYILKEIRSLYKFHPREWLKYLNSIEHLSKIPTWNRSEVYILLALKMWSPEKYRKITNLNMQPFGPILNVQQKELFIKAKEKILSDMIPDFTNIEDWNKSSEIRGKVLFDAIERLTHAIAMVNFEKKPSDDVKLEKSQLFSIFSALDYMN